MLKCYECGCVFSEDEVNTWEETHGLDCGPYEQWSGCPCCHGSYGEAQRCEICGDWFLPEELKDGVCEECGETNERCEICGDWISEDESYHGICIDCLKTALENKSEELLKDAEFAEIVADRLKEVGYEC